MARVRPFSEFQRVFYALRNRRGKNVIAMRFRRLIDKI